MKIYRNLKRNPPHCEKKQRHGEEKLEETISTSIQDKSEREETARISTAKPTKFESCSETKQVQKISKLKKKDPIANITSIIIKPDNVKTEQKLKRQNQQSVSELQKYDFKVSIDTKNFANQDLFTFREDSDKELIEIYNNMNDFLMTKAEEESNHHKSFLLNRINPNSSQEKCKTDLSCCYCKIF